MHQPSLSRDADKHFEVPTSRCCEEPRAREDCRRAPPFLSVSCSVHPQLVLSTAHQPAECPFFTPPSQQLG
ncbi:unnamed protein product [Urochloa humidicola]